MSSTIPTYWILKEDLNQISYQIYLPTDAKAQDAVNINNQKA